ncbi:hypothetical protein TorRG33x02_103800 [Trema orientale]|uniref:Uncharacterized protein n=1 Tax=Trema orientale TaxID=63057 RepID=A0A2P5F862_TREOI|nr:hypothetical protein TorRG33x02_103800 [Trema orientale]
MTDPGHGKDKRKKKSSEAMDEEEKGTGQWHGSSASALLSLKSEEFRIRSSTVFIIPYIYIRRLMIDY